jgi:hypothetical protein
VNSYLRNFLSRMGKNERSMSSSLMLRSYLPSHLSLNCMCQTHHIHQPSTTVKHISFDNRSPPSSSTSQSITSIPQCHPSHTSLSISQVHQSDTSALTISTPSHHIYRHIHPSFISHDHQSLPSLISINHVKFISDHIR